MVGKLGAHGAYLRSRVLKIQRHLRGMARLRVAWWSTAGRIPAKLGASGQWREVS
jgi:hypothetical protein